MMDFTTNLKLKNISIRQKAFIALVLVLLVIAAVFLAYRLKSGKQGPEEGTWEKTLGPTIQKTEKAHSVLKTDLPYTDPAGNFTIKYFEGSAMFVVDTGAKTWPEYAEKIKKSGEFFRGKGVDPCSLKRIWGANPVLLTIPKPAGLDFGCPVNAK